MWAQEFSDGHVQGFWELRNCFGLFAHFPPTRLSEVDMHPVSSVRTQTTQGGEGAR